MEQWTGSKSGKGYIKPVFCHLAYFIYMQSTSCEMTWWMKHKLESGLLGEILIPKICRWYHPYGRKQRGIKEPLEESGQLGLKLNNQKANSIASSPITSWQVDGETMETVTDFVFLGSKITAGGDGSREIKRCLLLGRKAMTNLDSILKTETLLCWQRPV